MASTQRPSKGISLSRGPAWIVGIVLLVAGLYFTYKVHNYPPFSQFPDGRAEIGAKVFFGLFGVNGWSAELTAAAGGLLLLGAAQHWLAKLTSFLVMVALGGVAIWALVHHHSALGLFAATTWTLVLWGGAAVVLLLNLPLPRLTPNTRVAENPAPRPAASPPPVATAAPAAAPAPEPVTAPVPTVASVASPEPPTVVDPPEPPTMVADEPPTVVADEPITEVDTPEPTAASPAVDPAGDEPVTTQITTEADPPTVERTVTSSSATRTGLAPAAPNASTRTSRARA